MPKAELDFSDFLKHSHIAAEVATPEPSKAEQQRHKQALSACQRAGSVLVRGGGWWRHSGGIREESARNSREHWADRVTRNAKKPPPPTMENEVSVLLEQARESPVASKAIQNPVASNPSRVP